MDAHRDSAETTFGARSGGWSRWQAVVTPAVIAVALIVITVFRGWEGATHFHLVARWLLVACLVGAAWFCRRGFALAAMLGTLGVWSWLESRFEDWSELAAGQLVRLAVAIGLVFWLSRLREQLVEAQRLARIDSLTGLPNRQALIEALESELGRAKRFGRPFSLALLDCDGFKEINDRSGHLTGDNVLRRIGESLRENKRPFDCAGRWGGDEFLIVFSEVDADDAKLIAERLRAGMRHHVERDYPSLAFSLGIVTFHNSDLDWPACVERADAAMYAAKRDGRDQTRFEVVDARATSPTVTK
jgi:diguanylate cyclase (GGDEF)-like protein